MSLLNFFIFTKNQFENTQKIFYLIIPISIMASFYWVKFALLVIVEKYPS